MMQKLTVHRTNIIPYAARNQCGKDVKLFAAEHPFYQNLHLFHLKLQMHNHHCLRTSGYGLLDTRIINLECVKTRLHKNGHESVLRNSKY